MDNYSKTYGYVGNNSSVDTANVFSKLMRSVYAWMCCGLTMTAFTALIVAKNAEILQLIAENAMVFWGLAIAEVALVVILSARINSMSFTTAGICFAGYAMLNGVTMSFIFLLYTMSSIAQTFFITAGTFGAMSIVGYVIKKDLSAMGRIFMMLLIGLIIATVVNIFVGSSGLAAILNYLGVIIFVGLTAYDTQKIKEMMLSAQQYGVSESTQKLALMGSLTLYLDFINLFLYLLRIFGSRRD